MTITQEPTFTGWRKAKGLGIGWMTPTDSAIVAALVVVWLGALMLAGWRAGLAIAPLVLIALGLSAPFDGLPTRWYLGREWRWYVTGRKERREYRSGWVHPVDGLPELPGPLAATRLVEVAAGVGQPDPWAVVWNRATGEVTATLEVTTQQAHLADSDTFSGWVGNWHRWLAGTCTDQAVAHVMVVVESSSVSGEALGDQILGSVSADAPPFAAELLTDLAGLASAGSTSVSVFVEITFTAAKLGEGRIDERVAEVARRLAGLQDSLRGCGVGSVRRASAARLAERMRAAFDPSAAGGAEVARRDGDHDGLRWRQCGPIATDEQRGALLLDSGAAVGWVWAEAPRSPVTARVLARLVDAGPYRKRVMLYWQPMAPAAAVAKLEAEKTAATTKQLVADRQKRDETARQARDRQLTAAAAAEEASGAGLGTLAIYVVVQVDRLDQVPDAVADVEARAGHARIRLRRATCSHAAIHATGLGAGIAPPRLAEGFTK